MRDNRISHLNSLCCFWRSLTCSRIYGPFLFLKTLFHVSQQLPRQRPMGKHTIHIIHGAPGLVAFATFWTAHKMDSDIAVFQHMFCQHMFFQHNLRCNNQCRVRFKFIKMISAPKVHRFIMFPIKNIVTFGVCPIYNIMVYIIYIIIYSITPHDHLSTYSINITTIYNIISHWIFRSNIPYGGFLKRCYCTPSHYKFHPTWLKLH